MWSLTSYWWWNLSFRWRTACSLFLSLLVSWCSTVCWGCRINTAEQDWDGHSLLLPSAPPVQDIVYVWLIPGSRVGLSHSIIQPFSLKWEIRWLVSNNNINKALNVIYHVNYIINYPESMIQYHTIGLDL